MSTSEFPCMKGAGVPTVTTERPEEKLISW